MTLPAPPSDIDLLRQLGEGNAAAFQLLYRRHQGPLFRFAVLRCGATGNAADVVQEVFMGLLTGTLRFDPLRGQLGHFLFGVARKLILRQELPRQREQALAQAGDEDDEDNGDDAALCMRHEPLARLLSDELAEQVRHAIAQLAPHYRDVLILYEMHELSYQEIAQICQVDIGTVRSRLSRARAAMSKRLAPHRPATTKEASA